MLDRVKDFWSGLATWQKWVSGLVPFTLLAVLSLNITSLFVGGDATTKEKESKPSASTRSTAGKMLAVKIDNVRAARPSTGVQKAKVVYVEQVEAGLTRLMAVFGSKDLPSHLGPVRSAREVDLDILDAYGTPGFAYSGATSKLIPHINRANVVDLSHSKASSLYYRGSLHYPPHNLYIRADSANLSKASGLTLETAEKLTGGETANRASVTFPAASYRFDWQDGSYAVYMDGQRARNTDTGPSTAGTVIIQHVTYGAAVRGSAATPYANTVGSGKAEMYRDGKVYKGEWKRNSLQDQTKYTYNGKVFVPDKGQTWIVLAR